jgi:hypothetical protein
MLSVSPPQKPGSEIDLYWNAPTEKDTATLDKRLWDAAELTPLS